MSDSMKTRPSTSKHGPLVIKLGGAAAEASEELDDLYGAIVHLHRTVPQGVVLVHGGGAAVDQHLKRLGLVSERRDGIRITPSDQIEEIVGVLAGRVNKRLVGRLQRCGAKAVGLCLGDGLVAQISRVTSLPIDAGRVGQVTGGNPRLITTLLDGGFLPVLASIGFDEEGQPLNVNADAAAAGLGRLLNASGLLFLTDTPGVLDQRGTPIATLCPRDIEAKIQSGDIRDGMIAKVRSAALASTTAAIPVTISSWHDPDALRNLIRDALVGTRILPVDDPAPATVPDSVKITHTTTVPNA